MEIESKFVDLVIWCAILLILLVQIIGDESMPVTGLLPTGLVIYLVDECIIFLFRKGFGNSHK